MIELALSEQLSRFRADRPDEWRMDVFIKLAADLEQQLSDIREAAQAVVDGYEGKKTTSWDLKTLRDNLKALATPQD